MRRTWITFIAAALAALPAIVAEAAPPEPLTIPSTPERPPVDPRMRNLLARLPLSFEVNRGQAPEGWDFLVRCRGYHAFVASDAVVFSFEGTGLRMSLEGASRCEPETFGLALPGSVNYFLGNDSEKWITEIPTTRGAAYRDAAPGTTWRFGSRERALEFEIDLLPGAEGPRLAFEGASAISVADDGSLRLAMPRGVARISAPIAWQDAPGVRIDAAAKWIVEKGGAVRIAVSPRDPTRGVRIDPTVTYESYLGGGSDDTATAAAMDAAGSAYIAGDTYSSSFPTTSGAYSTSLTAGVNGPRTDAYIVKMSASGSALAYATYFGGSSDEYVTAMQVDASGGAYVVGRTYSMNFPVTPGAYLASNGGNGVLLSLNASGSALQFSTCTLRNMATSVALGTNGGVYVVEGAELARYSSLGSLRDFGTSISAVNPGGGFNAVAADASGNAYAVGAIAAANVWPATTGAFRTTLAGGGDALVTKVDASGTVIWATYLGGSQSDEARFVGVNEAGQVYVGGPTSSSDFPVTSGAFAAVYANTGSYDGFLTRLDASGQNLRYSTYTNGITVGGLRVHRYSSWVCCGSVSPGVSVSASNGFQSNSGGATDGFVLSFNRDNTLAWSSFLGGSSTEYAGALGMAPDGSIVVAGATSSTDLPTVSPYQGTKQAQVDGFMIKIPDTLPTSVSALAVAESALPGATITAGYAHTIAGSGGISPYTWTFVSGSLPPGTTFSATGNVSGTPTQSGTFPFRVRIQDASEVVAEGVVSVTVNPLPSVPGAVLGTTLGTYSDRVVPVSGGTAPFTIDLLSGTVPAGLTLGTNGHVTGTATALGDATLSIRATDVYGLTATGNVTIRVNPAPAVVAATPPDATTTRPYSFTFTTSGGTAPFTWTLVSGAVPSATLGASSGALSGAAKSPGTYDFVVRGTDAVGAFAERAFSMDINAMPSISTIALKPMVLGRPFAQTLSVADGTPPFTWAPGSGDFPGGFVLDASTGRVSGTPSQLGGSGALFRCTDRWGADATRTITFEVATLVDLVKKKSSESLTFDFGGASRVGRAVELTSGLVLGITMSGGAVGDVHPQLVLTDAAGVPLDIAPFTKASKKSVTVKGFVVPATGRYFLTVTPAAGFTGKAKLSITISPRSTWASGASLDPAAPSAYAFSAPPGGLLAISAKAAKGTTVLPKILAIVGPDGTDVQATGTVKEKGGATSFASKTPLAGGDYRVTFSTRDANAGAATWAVKLKLPKTYDFAMTEVPAGD